jgi:hypothetical protein
MKKRKDFAEQNLQAAPSFWPIESDTAGRDRCR